jgi:predicted lysophospholipase L1 biosynthesis ABC-type transport system permease subunit
MKHLQENEVVEELASQLEECYLEAIDRGVTEEEADALACAQVEDWHALANDILRARPGGRAFAIERRAEETEQRLRKRSRLWAPFADVSQDVRFSLRTFRRRPLFAWVAILTLGLGIGAARNVAQRAREIGIRMALGARSTGLVGMFLRRSLAVGIAGILGGVVAAAWVSRLLSHFLFGVAARDLFTYGVVSSLLLFVCIAACTIPARRAARVEPMRVLREE